MVIRNDDSERSFYLDEMIDLEGIIGAEWHIYASAK